jgi:hypothetical protein
MQRRWVAILVMSLGLSGTAPRTVQACTCLAEFGEKPSYHAVFLGTVLREEGYVPPGWVRHVLSYLRISFEDHHWHVRVRTSWSGVTRPDVTVVTWVDSSCSAYVEVGKSYLFRTTSGAEDQAQERIGACEFRPRPVDLASFDETSVGESTAAIHWPPLPAQASSAWRWVVVLVVLLAASLGIILRRRARHAR